MLRSCVYCGKIHDSKIKCEKKPEKQKEHSNQNNCRNKGIWKSKTKEIKERDMYLCRICLEQGVLTKDSLEVHHIISIAEDEDKWLDNDNLLTVCRKHHEQCECGKIKRAYQRLLAGALVDIPPLSKT